MNKKVLQSMIILILAFLAGLYVIKILFPSQFALVVSSKNLLEFGAIIDKRIWLKRIVSGLTTFVVYWFFICAVTKRWYLDLKGILISLAIIVATRFMLFWDADIANAISLIGMFLIPLLYKADIRAFAIVYSVHYFSQLLSLKIRNLPIYLHGINSIVAILLTIECYLWLILFYLYFNYKKGGKENGRMGSTTIR